MSGYVNMIIKILIVVVVGATLLGLINNFMPDFWNMAVEKIKALFETK